MKKTLFVILTFSLLLILLSTSVSADTQLSLVVNGVVCDAEVLQYHEEMYVPLRTCLESMEGTVTWNPSGIVDAYLNSSHLRLDFTQQKMQLNGKAITPFSATLHNSTTYVQLDQLKKIFDITYEIEKSTNRLYIQYQAGIEPFITAEYPIVIVPGTLGTWSSIDIDEIRNSLDMNNGNTFTDAAFSLLKPVLLNILDALESFEANTNKYITKTNGKTYYVEPFWNVYVPLCEYLESCGLKQDEDYFIFGYDTLNESIEENAKQLREYIQDIKKATGAEKVQIIAHSQGGLVARQYIQENGGFVSTAKLLGICVPNHGVSFTYPLYAKGSFNPLDGREMFVSILAYLTYGDFSDESKMKYVQEHSKTIAQMLPTYLDTMELENTFLLQLNTATSKEKLDLMGKENILMLIGSGMDTVASYDDQEKPQYSPYGDGTVLISSGLIDETYAYRLLPNTKHTDPFREDSPLYDYIASATP